MQNDLDIYRFVLIMKKSINASSYAFSEAFILKISKITREIILPTIQLASFYFTAKVYVFREIYNTYSSVIPNI